MNYIPIRELPEESSLINNIQEPELASQSSLLENYSPAKDALQPIKLTENILSISIFAKPNNRFVSYDLLQAITSTGMQFGEMNIFHYYQRTPEGKKYTLFSLASATKPGEFDLDRSKEDQYNSGCKQPSRVLSIE